jgi:hypothetical protein
MTAPVYLSVWHPGIGGCERVPDAFPLFIRVYPLDSKLKVTADAKEPVITDLQRCGEYFVCWVTKFPADEVVELRVHATPKDPKKWIEAYQVCYPRRKESPENQDSDHSSYNDSCTLTSPSGGTSGNPVLETPYFQAFGDCDPTTAITNAYIQKDGTGTQIPGTSMTTPPPGADWCYLFQNIGTGTCLLTVTVEGGDPQTCWIRVQ